MNLKLLKKNAMKKLLFKKNTQLVLFLTIILLVFGLSLYNLIWITTINI